MMRSSEHISYISHISKIQLNLIMFLPQVIRKLKCALEQKFQLVSQQAMEIGMKHRYSFIVIIDITKLQGRETRDTKARNIVVHVQVLGTCFSLFKLFLHKQLDVKQKSGQHARLAKRENAGLSPLLSRVRFPMLDYM